MADFKEIQIGEDGQVYQVKDATARESAGSGGEGTVTAVKMNNGAPIEPDDNGVVNLGTVITQHQDISGKVDKVAGKGLSTNDYTTAEKAKLAGLSNDYNDLSNKPTIPDVSGLATKTELNTGLAGKVDKNGTDSLMTAAEHTKLQNLPTATELGQSFAGKQDTLTFDNAPTAGSNNPVKSGGIKTALDNLLANISIGQNGNWFIGQTDTNVKAQGPKGDTLLVDGSFNPVTDIVNSLETGGTNKALSAEMGKELAGLVDELGYDVITTQHTQSLEVDSQNTGTVNAAAESQTCEIDWDVPQSGGGVPQFTNIAVGHYVNNVPYASPATDVTNRSIFGSLGGDYANGGSKVNNKLLRAVTFTLGGNAKVEARYYFIINETTKEVTDMSTSTATTQLSAGTYTVLSYGDTLGTRPFLTNNDGTIDVTSAYICDLTETYGAGNEPAKADIVSLFGSIRLGSSDSTYTPSGGSSTVLSVTRGGTVVATATYGTDTTITVQGGDELSLSGNGSASVDVDYETTERQKKANVWTNQVASLLAVVLAHVTFDDASTGQAAASALITLLTAQNQQQ